MAAPTDKAPTDPFVAPAASGPLPNRCVFPGCENYAAKSESGPQMYMCYQCLVEYMTWRAGHGNPVYDGESLSDLFPHEQFVTYVHTTKSSNLPPREADPYFDALKCATPECQIRVQRPQTMCSGCLQPFITEQQHSQRQETPAVIYPRNPYGVPLNQAEPTPLPQVQEHPAAQKQAPAPPAPEVQRLQVPQTVALQRFGVANKCKNCDILCLNGRSLCIECSQNHGMPIWRQDDYTNRPLYAPHVPASEIVHPKHTEPTVEGLLRSNVGGDSQQNDGLVNTAKEMMGVATKFVTQLKERKAGAAASKAKAAESA